MDQKCDRFCPSAPIRQDNLEKRLEKKLNDVNSLNNHMSSNKELFTYFEDKNNKSKKKYKTYKTLTARIKSFDTFVVIATTSSSITLSLTGIGLVAIPISIATTADYQLLTNYLMR